MTLTAEQEKILADKAAIRLDRLYDCRGIAPRQAGDEAIICGNCGFEVYPIGGTWRHSEAEIRAMRALATDWPR